MSGYYYSDDPSRHGGGDLPVTSGSGRGLAAVSPAPRLADTKSVKSRSSGGSSRDLGAPPSYSVYQQYPRAEIGKVPSGTSQNAATTTTATGRRTSVTFQPISFNTGGECGPSLSSITPSASSILGQFSLVSPPYPAEERQTLTQQQQQRRLMISPSPHDRERLPPTSPRGIPPAALFPNSGRKSLSGGDRRSNRPGSERDDSFTLSGNQYAQFTPPSSAREPTDDDLDRLRRQRSDRPSSFHSQHQLQQQTSPPPLPTHRLVREGSGSVRGLQSPSLPPQQLASSGQSGRSTRGLVSPRLDGPTFVDPEGNNMGGPQRGPVPYRKAGSFGSVSGQSDEQQQVSRGSPSARSKGFPEAHSSGGGFRRDEGSSLEGSSRRGSFQTSPSLQRRESLGGGTSRAFDREASRTVYSRLSSPGISFGFGSPTSTGERSLNRGGGGARTPRFGESGGTTPRALSFQRGRIVGSGGFGTVFQAILSDGTLAAVKELKLDTTNLKAIDREVHTMSSLPPHPNCVRYFGSRHSKNHYYIIMEYISGGSIQSLRQSVGRFRESVFQRYAYMVLLGLEHLHENGIIHRDIKGANVLLDERGCAKIVDFGCCKDLNQSTQTLGGGGTPLWMAPEVCRGDTATVKSDVWAFGCLCLEMTNDTGLPWSFPSTMTLQGVAYALASAQNPPPIPATLSEVAQDFIACCLRLNPEERLDVSELLSHPFFDLDYVMDSESEDELIVSREPSARESAVKRMMKNVNDKNEGIIVNPLHDGNADGQQRPAPPARGEGGAANTLLTGDPHHAISFSTAGKNTRTSGGAVGASASAASLQQTVNVGFLLDAVDEDSDSGDENGKDGGGVALRPVESRGTGGADAESYAEDAEYMATVNDIICRARKSSSSHGIPPNPRSSTATGGHATTHTNTTGTGSASYPRHTQASQLDFSSATSSSTFTSGRSSSSSSFSSSASSSPRLAGTNRTRDDERANGKNGGVADAPSDPGYTKAPASRRVYQHIGDSPEPESISPREPEGGTKPKPSRVDDNGNKDGTNFSRTSTAGAKTFQRRSTFPLTGTASRNGGSASTSATNSESRRRSDSTLKPAGKQEGPAPGGPSRVRPADPPGPTYPSSDGVSKTRSSANSPSTRLAHTTRTTPSSSSTIGGAAAAAAASAASTNAAESRDKSKPSHVDRGDAVYTFSSSSQGCVAPTKKSRPPHSSSDSSSGMRARAASGGKPSSSSPGLGRSRMWESGGRDSISKDFTATLREVRDIISHTRSDDRPRAGKKESEGSGGDKGDKGDKKKSGTSKWFSRS